jgi:TonB family protein
MTDYGHDIEKYLKGELTPTERNALERKALHDPFLADALEGAEQINIADFSKDVSALNKQIAAKKSTSVWMWPARIAAGLVILLVSSYIVWTFMNPDPIQDLAFKKSEPAVTPSTPADSANPTSGALSSAEQPGAGPAVRDKDFASRSTNPLKLESKPKQETTGEPEPKNGPLVDAIIADNTKTEVAKTEDISVTEPVAAAKPLEKEEAVSRAKASDDFQERKLAKKKDAAPAAADKSVESLASLAQQNVIRGKVTSSEDGTALPGVNVLIKGTTIGTVTNAEGDYSIAVDKTNPTLVYSFIGLQNTEVEVKEATELNIQMSVDATQLSEVVVTAQGIQRETRALGYAVSGPDEDVTPLDLAHPQIGYRSFKQYLEKNLRYPEQAKANKVEGRVTVQFTVEPDGALSNFTILRGIGSGCDEELIRLIKEGSKWVPTKKNDLPVQDKVKVRLKFELPN